VKKRSGLVKGVGKLREGGMNEGRGLRLRAGRWGVLARWIKGQGSIEDRPLSAMGNWGYRRRKGSKLKKEAEFGED